jgi:hypothetical protein
MLEIIGAGINAVSAIANYNAGIKVEFILPFKLLLHDLELQILLQVVTGTKNNLIK